jgi:mannose-6-phosphate isomerase-like protein (cupin superfamily)
LGTGSRIAGFTKINLKEIEDTTPVDEIEGRFARKHLDSQHLGVTYWRYAPNYRSGMGHSHREQEEAYIVVSGSGRMKLDDEIVELRQWDVVRVAPQTVRGLEAGPDGIEFVAVGSDRPEGGDGNAVPDWWTD